MIKLIIAGGRDFTDVNRIIRALKKVIIKHGKNNIEVVSGGARGADKAGEVAARKLGLKVKQFPAKWEKYGKSAGYRRNEEMADYATHVVAFWDGKSRGTKHMIDIAKKRGMPLYVGKY